MDPQFTAHNIRLDNGRYTCPDVGYTIADHPWCKSAAGLLGAVFPGDKSRIRVADLGCLEGGYTAEFARLGFQAVGIEVRQSNFQACQYVKANTSLDNLEFIHDDVWNVAKYGTFDAVFCCGLLYHLDRPKDFLQLVSSVTRRLLIVQTHFATDRPNATFTLSELTDNESLVGRWYTEYADDRSYVDREAAKWSAWGNRRSFWLRKDHLLQAIQDAGFDLVFEQFDGLGPNIVDEMSVGEYATTDRGTFVGMKVNRSLSPVACGTGSGSGPPVA
jgi:SAM-dependent methyltransferase